MRSGCAAAAVATLSYNYQQRTVWLEPRWDEAHPSTYDLCDEHSSRISVPVGWELADRRHVPYEVHA